jgi:hypothetical protein
MVILPGTGAAVALLLVRVTVAPPPGAAADSVAVACTPLVPTTVEGFSETDARAEAGVAVG